ncbi:MAG TPA: prepilin-type N-terminal cleavage/methylation domain-containing protein [Nitrospirota bacterium]|nr:prepilin-type N-terminal cleavage/methylation domain-containing protein [Nitrospirota bacterium]
MVQRPRGDKGRHNSAKGFTLIELTIIIVILGVMLSLIIPRLGEIGEANLKRSARHLTGMIRYLRDESQARKAVYRLRFDVQGGRFWTEVMTLSADQSVEFTRLQSEIGTEGSLAGQTTFRDVKVAGHPDDPYIQFTPDGWVENAAIHLRDGDGKDFTLFVNPLLGSTELREGYVEDRES